MGPLWATTQVVYEVISVQRIAADRIGAIEHSTTAARCFVRWTATPGWEIDAGADELVQGYLAHKTPPPPLGPP